MLTRLQNGVHRVGEANVAVIIWDRLFLDDLQATAPRQYRTLTFGQFSSALVEGPESESLGRMYKWTISEIETTLLEGHEGGGSKDAIIRVDIVEKSGVWPRQRFSVQVEDDLLLGHV